MADLASSAATDGEAIVRRSNACEMAGCHLAACQGRVAVQAAPVASTAGDGQHETKADAPLGRRCDTISRTLEGLAGLEAQVRQSDRSKSSGYPSDMELTNSIACRCASGTQRTGPSAAVGGTG